MPQLHYFDKVRARAGIAEQYNQEPPVQIDAIPLAQTDFEKRAVRELLAVVQEFLRETGYESKTFPSTPVTFLDTQDFRHLFSEGDAGSTTYRRAYVCRDEEKVNTIHLISHELAHVSSYAELAVIGENNHFRINQKRSGVEISRFDKPKIFVGLNEAITEMMAIGFRRFFVGQTDLLNEDESHRLMSTVAYWHQVHLIDCLLNILTETFSEFTKMDLFDDYFGGTFHTVRACERLFPGSAKLLANMGKTPEDAIHIAEELGLDEVLSDFEDLPTSS